MIHGQTVKSHQFSVRPVVHRTPNDSVTDIIQLRCHRIGFSTIVISPREAYVS